MPKLSESMDVFLRNQECADDRDHLMEKAEHWANSVRESMTHPDMTEDYLNIYAAAYKRGFIDGYRKRREGKKSGPDFTPRPTPA